MLNQFNPQQNPELWQAQATIKYLNDRLTRTELAMQRRARRKLTNAGFAETEDGLIFLESFNNGEVNKIRPFTPVVKWILVQRISSTTMTQVGEYFLLILHLANGKDVTEYLPLEILKRGDMLLDVLLDNDLQPSPEIQFRKLSLALRSFVRRKLMASYEFYKMSPLAGWDHSGLFLDGDAFPGIPRVPADDFPVIGKIFKTETLTSERIDAFSEELRQFDIVARYFLAIFPLTAVVHSILSKLGRPVRLMLSILCSDGFQPIWIADYFQIFNRDHPLILDGGTTITKLEPVISRFGDEICLIDGRIQDTEPRARKDNAKCNLTRLETCVSGASGLSNGEKIRGLIAALSTRNLKGSVINLEFPLFSELSQETHRRFVELKCQEALLGLIVNEVKADVNAAENLLASHVDVEEPLLIPFAATERLVNSALARHGYPTLTRLLDLPDDYINTLVLSNIAEINAENLMRAVLRSAMPSLSISEKSYSGEFNEDCLYYDDESVYVPTRKMQLLFEEAFHRQDLPSTLRDLKEKGLLIPNSGSYTFKMQVGGNRTQFYRLQRSFLSNIGQVEILALAGSVIK